MKGLKILRIDRYIIQKFLGTFFLALCLIMVIAVVFDFSEKVDNFMANDAPWKEVIFGYYANFIPYFATLFAPLFVFASVIFFTSKMAANTEIIAILSGGMSFRRMMWPYFLSSSVICVLIFCLMNFVIPKSNLKRAEFENVYYKPKSTAMSLVNIHRQIYPNVYLYMETYSPSNQKGRNITIEQFGDDGRLVSKLSADNVAWDSLSNKWMATNYILRTFEGSSEKFDSGSQIDTSLNIYPDDLARSIDLVSTMSYTELRDYIDLLTMQGSDETKAFLVEKHSRIATPFSVFILTLIGVSLSSRKVRGGIGMNIGVGLALSFSYILFQQFASQFSLKGSLNPMLAMWIPNIIYAIIAAVLYKLAPK
ncbi:MAG: LptF/LptG family permease [Bacteroidales bacterium]|nr:LptF/LptG family permease [Bacteroidales bacterium]